MAKYVTKIRTEHGDKQIDYNALANLPELPTVESIGAAKVDHKHTAQEVGALPSTTTIPTKVSQLENDKGFKTTDNNTTYTLTKSGSTITLTGSDGSKNSVTDSNNTYSLSSFGIKATADELNYVDGVTSSIQTQLDGKAASKHSHTYLPLTGGKLTDALTVSGLVLTEKKDYGTESQRPAAGVKGRIFFQKVVS